MSCRHLEYVDPALLERMEVEFLVSWRGGARRLVAAFYDPEHSPRPKAAMPEHRRPFLLGGFPHHFRITVDAETWKVVDVYASPY